MAPKPLRQQTRRAAAEEPRTLAASFLHDAAHEASKDGMPHLAALFGRRSLQVASGHHGALTRSQANSICKSCGIPRGPGLPLEDTDIFKLSKKARQRLKKKRSSTQKDGSSKDCSAGVSRRCSMCGVITVKYCTNVEVAREVVESWRQSKQLPNN